MLCQAHSPTIPSQQSQHPNVFGISHPSTGRFSFSTSPLSWVHFAVDDLTTQALSNGGSHDPCRSRGSHRKGKHRVSQEKRKANTSCHVFKRQPKIYRKNHEMNIKHPNLLRRENLKNLETGTHNGFLQPKCAMDFFKALSVAVSTKSSNRSIAAVKSSP